MTVNGKTYGLASDPKGTPLQHDMEWCLATVNGQQSWLLGFQSTVSAASPLLPCRDAEANSCLYPQSCK